MIYKKLMLTCWEHGSNSALSNISLILYSISILSWYVLYGIQVIHHVFAIQHMKIQSDLKLCSFRSNCSFTCTLCLLSSLLRFVCVFVNVFDPSNLSQMINDWMANNANRWICVCFRCYCAFFVVLDVSRSTSSVIIVVHLQNRQHFHEPPWMNQEMKKIPLWHQHSLVLDRHLACINNCARVSLDNLMNYLPHINQIINHITLFSLDKIRPSATIAQMNTQANSKVTLSRYIAIYCCWSLQWHTKGISNLSLAKWTIVAIIRGIIPYKKDVLNATHTFCIHRYKAFFRAAYSNQLLNPSD